MKNQKVLRILALVFAVAMMLTIASCEMLDQLLGKAPEHVHTEESIPAVAPTCTSIGLTEGKKCSDCGEILVAQETVAALGHKEVAVPAKEATCTTIGLTEGKKCSACDTWIVAQEVVNAKGHSEETLAAVEPTCTEKGLTEGKKCTVCGVTTVAQKEVDALGHAWGEEVTVTVEPTCGEDGKGTVGCTACDATNEVVVDATGDHTWDKGVQTVAPSCADGVKTFTCLICGGNKEEAIPGNGQHAYGEDFVIYNATCTTAGLKGKTCSICNTTKKVELAAYGKTHSYTDGKCTTVVGQETLEDGTKVDILCGACEKHTYLVYTKNDPTDPRYNIQWGICDACGYVDVNHEHLIKDGVCYYCDYVYDEVPQGSIVDNDGDKVYDIFYFAQALPERFRQDEIYVNAKTDDKSSNHSSYDEIDANKSPYMPYPHNYAAEKTQQHLDYEVTVPKTGTYEVAIYLRVKDEKVRGALFTINAGTPYEYTFETSYTWKDANDRAEVQNNSFLIGVYMFVEMDLVEGKNTFSISTPSYFEKSQHFRAFFFNFKEDTHVCSYDKEEVTTAPTCSTKGVMLRTCTECGKSVTKAIDYDYKAHSIVDGVCTACGASELNENDIAWLTANGLDASKYLKLDLKFAENMNRYYNPTNNTSGGKWVAESNKHEMSTRMITKAEMGVGSIIRIDHLATDEDGKWATMIQYRPEFFIGETGKCVAAARQSGVKVGGMLEVTDEWWTGITEGRKSDKFDTVTFSLTVLDVTAVADEDSKYTTAADKNYTLTEADYDNFVIYVLK